MPFDGRNQSKAAGVLIEARNLVEEGWCRRSFMRRDDQGNVRYCIVGAIDAACRDGLDDELSYLRAHAVNRMVEAAGTRNRGEVGISIWNDSWRRTKEEVLQAFDRAIEKELTHG
jgi:hypothetical protein